MTGARPRLLLVATFLCVAAVHVWMVWMAPNALSFSEGHVHTDNAVMPLMGKHLLDRGEFPIFYYGQDWFGSLPAVVHAAVFLTLGGSHPGPSISHLCCSSSGGVSCSTCWRATRSDPLWR